MGGDGSVYERVREIRDLFSFIRALFQHGTPYGEEDTEPDELAIRDNRGGKLVVEFREHRGEYGGYRYFVTRDGRAHKLARDLEGDRSTEWWCTDKYGSPLVTRARLVDPDHVGRVDRTHFRDEHWPDGEQWCRAFAPLMGVWRCGDRPFKRLVEGVPDYYTLRAAEEVVMDDAMVANLVGTWYDRAGVMGFPADDANPVWPQPPAEVGVLLTRHRTTTREEREKIRDTVVSMNEGTKRDRALMLKKWCPDARAQWIAGVLNCDPSDVRKWLRSPARCGKGKKYSS